jgi:hypothetical protein
LTGDPVCIDDIFTDFKFSIFKLEIRLLQIQFKCLEMAQDTDSTAAEITAQYRLFMVSLVLARGRQDHLIFDLKSNQSLDLFLLILDLRSTF